MDILLEKELSDMNKTLLTGRLTRDAELLDFSSSERKAVKFILAVDRPYKNFNSNQTADFIPVVYFTNYASKIISYLTKGRLISVSGRISVRTAKSEDGSKRYFTDIIADNIDFLDSIKSKAL